MLCTIHYTSSFRNTKQQKQCPFSKELAICILHSELGTGNVKGNMMIMRMRVVTDLINYRNYSLALLHCCLYTASLELLRPGKRWVVCNQSSRGSHKTWPSTPISWFLHISFPFFPFSFPLSAINFHLFLLPYSSNTKLHVIWRLAGKRGRQ